MYVDTDDVNVHLPSDKLQLNEAELELWDREAGRIIRGYVASVFSPTTIAAWADPASTPEVIRGIAGRLIAAAYYAERFSEDDTSYPEYAQNLYDQATNGLLGIQTGATTVLSVDGSQVVETTETHSLTDDDFWPNDATDRFFSMGDTF